MPPGIFPIIQHSSEMYSHPGRSPKRSAKRSEPASLPLPTSTRKSSLKHQLPPTVVTSHVRRIRRINCIMRFRVLFSLFLLLCFAQLMQRIRRIGVSFSRDDPFGVLEKRDELDLNVATSTIDPTPSSCSQEQDAPKEAGSESEWCIGEECLRGTWVPRSPPFNTIQELRDIYANHQETVWWGCRIPDNNISQEELKKKAGKRLLDVMNWVWVPERGKMREWNVEEFVVRLLRSAGGIILVGDSITAQHFHVLGYAIRQSGLEFDEDPSNLPVYKHKNVHQYVLRNNTPLAHRLIERAGVPFSRLERPLFTFLEEHMLIGEHEIREITAMYGASKKYYPWYHDFQRVEKWERFVARAVKRRRMEIGYTVEDSIIVLNTGAHWSRHEFSMLPKHDSHAEQQERLALTFKEMLRRIRTRLSAIPNLTILYRATSPGHPQCHLASSPYRSLELAQAPESPEHIPNRLLHTPGLSEEEKDDRHRWDWDRFEVHNSFWRESIRKMKETRKRLGLLEGARWEYLDVWGLGLMRPDAHSKPGIDCLHWCQPGMLEEWNNQIYQAVIPIEGLDVNDV